MKKISFIALIPDWWVSCRLQPWPVHVTKLASFNSALW